MIVRLRLIECVWSEEKIESKSQSSQKETSNSAQL